MAKFTWTKARIKKMLTTKKANAILRAATIPNRSKTTKVKQGVPIDSHYVGETAQASTLDVNRIEDRAFRRGLFTGLQMVVDLLIRELR